MLVSTSSIGTNCFFFRRKEISGEKMLSKGEFYTQFIERESKCLNDINKETCTGTNHYATNENSRILRLFSWIIFR